VFTLVDKNKEQLRVFNNLAEGRIWRFKELFKQINRLLIKDLEITKNGLVHLISKQHKFRVFRNSKNKETYYIFIKNEW